MGNFFTDFFTIYSTTRVVRIRSKFLAATYVTLVILVWCAFLGSYELDFRNVYQKSCDATGAVSTKVKGVVSTQNFSDRQIGTAQPQLYRRIWDVSDTVFPPYGGNEFFVLTNLIITPNQTLGICPESEKAKSSRCTSDSDCVNGTISDNGLRTGICNLETKTCEISAWCPTEEDVLPFKGTRAILSGTKDFTLMIKNSIHFPDCGDDYQRRNIVDNATSEYLSSCMYDPKTNPYCPIFRLGDIVQWSGQDYSQVAITGGVFTIEIAWDCQFDWGISINDCLPKYTFKRTDEPNPKISPGWNFRSAMFLDESRRTLTKQYGLKFIVEITGEGKKFDFLKSVLTVGASIGLFALAPLVCDFLFDMLCLLRNCYPLRKWYSNFSEEIRYQGHYEHIPNKITPTKYQMGVMEMANMNHGYGEQQEQGQGPNPRAGLNGNTNGGFVAH